VSLRIRTRLTLWYTALLAAILLAAGIFLVLRLRVDLVRQTDRALTLAANEISVDYKSGGESEFRDVTDASLAGLPREQSAAQILAPGGRVLDAAGDPGERGSILGHPDIALVLRGGTILKTIRLGRAATPFRVIAFRFGPGTGQGVLVVATSLAEVERSASRLIVLLLIAGPLALIAAAAGGWWLAGRALRPVARMTAEAREIGADRLTDRVDVPKAADELQGLATTLNGMLDRLAAAMDRQRRFVADASHELRTPLAVMRAELDVSLGGEVAGEGAREVLESAREEVERMSRTVNDMLVLAQADEGRLALARDPVDLSDVAAVVLSRVKPYADARRTELRLAGGPAPALADRSRLEHVISNLVDNALRHSPEGKTVVVTTWRSERGSGITVADQGPGMPPEILEHVFDRFFRGDPARGGPAESSGLGLAICKEIVSAHGGEIWVTSRPGDGSAFSLSIPSNES